MEGGLDPWAWACVRASDPKTALRVGCELRYRNRQACQCTVDAVYATDEDPDLLAWLSYTEASHPDGSRGRFEEKPTGRPPWSNSASPVADMVRSRIILRSTSR